MPEPSEGTSPTALLAVAALSAAMLALEITLTRLFALAQFYHFAFEEGNRHQRLPDAAYADAFAALLDEPGVYVDAHPYDIRPPTDDRPFFFHYFRWRQTPAILAGLGKTWQPFGGSGYLALVLSARLGLLMGIPFARGLAVVEARAPGLTPWAWAVNGSTSVVAGVVAVMVAVSWGFSVVLWSGAAAYAVAFLAIRRLTSTPGATTLE